jgi:hypothetical protein
MTLPLLLLDNSVKKDQNTLKVNERMEENTRVNTLLLAPAGGALDKINPNLK